MITSHTVRFVYYHFLTFVAEIAARTASVGEVYTAPFVVDTHTTHKTIILRIHFTHTHKHQRAHARRVIGNPTGAEKRSTRPVIRERTTSDLKCQFRTRENLSAEIFRVCRWCLRPGNFVAQTRELNAKRIRPVIHARTRGPIDRRTNTHGGYVGRYY